MVARGWGEGEMERGWPEGTRFHSCTKSALQRFAQPEACRQ